jgi:hypothetical protein
VGGCAHLLNFDGTDTMSAAYYAQFVLNNGKPVGQSIPATEHRCQKFPEWFQMFPEWCRMFHEWCQMFTEWCEMLPEQRDDGVEDGGRGREQHDRPFRGRPLRVRHGQL